MGTLKTNHPRSKPWSFAYVADIHVGTPRSYRFQPAWNENWQTARKQIIELKPEFLIVGGDLTRDGATHRFELEQIKADLDSLPFPYYAIPGNHEVGNKFLPDSSVSIRQEYLNLYHSVFGPSRWSFIYQNVRFSGLDALLFGSGLPEEHEQWQWLQAQVKAERAQYHVWFMHQAFFIDDLHEPNWDCHKHRNAWYFGINEPHRSRMFDVFKKTGTDLVITAHIHCRKIVRAEGITFYFAPATAFPQWRDRWDDGDATLGFLNCQVTEQGIEPEFIPLQKISDKLGYGPGGNPPLAGRDYSVAWQKPPLDVQVERFPRGTK